VREVLFVSNFFPDQSQGRCFVYLGLRDRCDIGDAGLADDPDDRPDLRQRSDLVKHRQCLYVVYARAPPLCPRPALD